MFQGITVLTVKKNEGRKWLLKQNCEMIHNLTDACANFIRSSLLVFYLWGKWNIHLEIVISFISLKGSRRACLKGNILAWCPIFHSFQLVLY